MPPSSAAAPPPAASQDRPAGRAAAPGFIQQPWVHYLILGSFLVFNQLGYFPVAAQNVYLIGSPTFPRSTLTLSNGRTFSVVADNTSEKNLYIAKATWNNKPMTRSWFTHDELMAGGELHLTMTDQPTHWDTGAPPPSMSDKP